MKQHYTTLYAQLCMQAQHKYFSGKTLSGRGMCLRRDLMNVSVVPAQHALIVQSLCNGMIVNCSLHSELLYEQTVHTAGISIPATTEDPFLRFARTQRLPDTLAP